MTVNLVDTDDIKQLDRIVNGSFMPRQVIDGLPALREAMERARAYLATTPNPDRAKCRELFMEIMEKRRYTHPAHAEFAAKNNGS